MALVGLRASYHRVLGKIEHLLPAKLRPLYNHPAGNVKLSTDSTSLFWMCLYIRLKAWCKS